MNVLVIAAHPDDEVLGCGGTIARLAAEGAAVSILILADGLTSRADFDSTRAAELLLIHHERARHAAAVLGAREVNLAGFPDQKMDTIPLLDITQVIEREIARVQPHTIFTQHGGDLNMDHVITYRATLTATRPMSGRCVPRVLAYEIASSTEWAFQKIAPVVHPQVFFDIAPSRKRSKPCPFTKVKRAPRRIHAPRRPFVLSPCAGAPPRASWPPRHLTSYAKSIPTPLELIETPATTL
jgi:LmbE family N-acetylglucosaminyl deacetylase